MNVTINDLKVIHIWKGRQPMSCRIAICDDNPIDSAYVEKLLNIWACERGIPIFTEIFPSAEAFLFRYEEDKTFDFLLLEWTALPWPNG